MLTLDTNEKMKDDVETEYRTEYIYSSMIYLLMKGLLKKMIPLIKKCAKIKVTYHSRTTVPCSRDLYCLDAIVLDVGNTVIKSFLRYTCN